jgi:hypothetical protein
MSRSPGEVIDNATGEIIPPARLKARLPSNLLKSTMSKT